jgi:2,3-bisphosphoglycerate-independent phosphoglycerate mutase
MSAYEVTDAICNELSSGIKPDFVCLNFANVDMVGHTGDYNAIIKAVETVDDCAKKVVETGMANGYSFLIFADHGNADYAINKDGTPNPVPCILIDSDYKKINNGILADVAPTVLKIMGIEQPEEMTGKHLL